MKIVLNHSIIIQQEIQHKGNASVQKKSVQYVVFFVTLFQEKTLLEKVMLEEPSSSIYLLF